jgi:hypothetical protein
LDRKLAISAVGNGDMVIAPDHGRLRDWGIETLRAGITVSDKIRAKVTLKTKDAGSAQKLHGTLEERLGNIKAEGEQALATEKEKELKELIVKMLDVLKSVTLLVKDRTVTLEGHAGVSAMPAMIKAWFTVRTERSGG